MRAKILIAINRSTPFLFCLYVCIHVCRIITYLGLVVFIFRITVSAIYLAL